MRITDRDVSDIPIEFEFESGVTLKFQSGPRQEFGANGLVADEVLEALRCYSKAIAKVWPTPENQAQVAAVAAAAAVVRIRTERRKLAGAEGTSAGEL